MLPIGITGGTPVGAPTGVAPTPVADNAAADGLTALGGSAVVHACGTDNGPIDTARPRPADTACPPDARPANAPGTPEPNPRAMPDSAALTPEADAVVVAPTDLPIENSELMLDMGVFAIYAAVRSGIESVFKVFTAEMGEPDDPAGEARLCSA